MYVRRSDISDMDEIMSIYACARSYMVEHGNSTQWQNGYPQKEVVLNDISNKNSYVIVNQDKIVGVFSFIIGEDPTYQTIENGNWHCKSLYGTIHRLASSQKVRGIAKICFNFCLEKMNYIRIDTHKENQSMQRAIEKFGFQKCGTIYVRDGSARIAYDLKRENTK